jgi:hypothetical protein
MLNQSTPHRPVPLRSIHRFGHSLAWFESKASALPCVMAEKVIIATVCASALVIGPHMAACGPHSTRWNLIHAPALFVCSNFILTKSGFLI